MRPASLILAIGLVCSAARSATPTPSQRRLSFEDRVAAQTAIERVYYAHQLGTTKPFDEAVPKSVLEGKVRKYLDQTVALGLYWKTSVTDEMLQRELERMANGTKMPERLTELYAALGNDPFLIKECLARATLVDRLTHNFFAFDSTIHAQAREEAEALHRRLASGELSVSSEHSNRTVSEISVGEPAAGPVARNKLHQQLLTPEELERRRAGLPVRIGEISDVKESAEGFAFDALLGETAKSVRVASYVVSKTTWDAWWGKARIGVGGVQIATVAREKSSSRVPVIRELLGKTAVGSRVNDFPCSPEGEWDGDVMGDLPDRRDSHTAVWTGNEMIVWGGIGKGSAFNTGSRYDPATDTWSSTTTIGAPAARGGHTAVWTGREMIVWGGGYSTGGRYDPAADRWSPTTTIGAPAARAGHTAVWTGSLMLIWGGGSNTGGRYDPLTDSWTPTSTIGAPSGGTGVWTGSLLVLWDGGTGGGRYDPVADRWTAMSTDGAPSARSAHTSIWTGTLMVVWGGGGSTYEYFDSGGRYDPATDRWTPMSLTDAPSPRSFHSAVWTGTEMVVWGGWRTYPDTHGAKSFYNSGGRYNPVTDSWTPTSTSDAPSGRLAHTATWTGSLMLVWGGRESERHDNRHSWLVDTGGRYDPADDSWTPTSMADAPSARYDHTAVWTGSQMIVWGGQSDLLPYTFDTGGRYDPATDNWTPTSTTDAPNARYRHTALWTGSQMLIWGGNWSSTIGGRYDPVADTWTPMSTEGAPDGGIAVWTGRLMLAWSNWNSVGGRYDPASDTWTPMSTPNAPILNGQYTGLWTGRLMLVLGDGGYPDYVLGGGRYDPESDTWNSMSMESAPLVDGSCTTVWTGREMLVWGGKSSTSYLNSGGRYNPTTDTWTPVSTTAAPASSFGHTAVWTGSVMIVWGGTFGVTNSGARYDPETDLWTPTSMTGVPAARYRHTAVWTGDLMLIWGGAESGTDDREMDSGGGYRVGATPDRDGDGFMVCQGDCNDHDATVYPGAPQLCDGINNDCSDPAWPATPSNEADSDHDGVRICQGDCDDHDAAVYPGAPQLCDGRNNDCNDPTWPTVAPWDIDADGDAFPLCADDCDDTNPTVHPGAPESCNGIDDNCDGVIDNGGDSLCDDANVCTDDLCKGAGGCLHVANANGCDDANPCTLGDTCLEGRCSGVPVDGISCDDGSACTINDTCAGGVCHAGILRDCDDGNLCTDDGCDARVGCVHLFKTGPCDDGNACTRGDTCIEGTCTSGPYDGCDDDNPCTDDTCDTLLGCMHTFNSNPCDDGNVCTLGDVCVAGVCLPSTGSLFCDDHNACTTDACNPYVGCMFVDISSLCDDHNPCTDDSCDAERGCISVNASNACSDGNPCTAGDFCLDGVCISGPPEVCHDNNACTDDRCDPVIGCYFPNNTKPCTDLNECTKGDLCGGGYCHPGTPRNCDDYNPCTNDSCDRATGCVHVNNFASCDDGDACTTGDVCRNGACHGAPRSCDDYNPCTNDSCEPATGCLHTIRTGSCDDGNACTTFDACLNGSCRGTDVLDCDDKNVCTTDTCSPAVGCVHTSNTIPCNDRNACTQTDVCSGGSCVGTNPVVCAPAGTCREGGACDPATGACTAITIQPDGTVCDDASICTGGDRCKAGACTPSFTGLSHPRNKPAGYYEKLCDMRQRGQLPYQGDQLTDADAVCVGQLVSTFAGLANVDGLCDVIHAGHHGGRNHGGSGAGPDGRDCDSGENELIAAALNLCRARLCETQTLDTRCGGRTLTLASRSLADADGILDSAGRDTNTCRLARCALREINNGQAMEMTSMVVALEEGNLRLTWAVPIFEDGSGTPGWYEVWRRAMGSNDAFVKIGSTQDTTFLDAAAGTAAWEYDVTAVFPED